MITMKHMYVNIIQIVPDITPVTPVGPLPVLVVAPEGATLTMSIIASVISEVKITIKNLTYIFLLFLLNPDKTRKKLKRYRIQPIVGIHFSVRTTVNDIEGTIRC